MPSMVTAYDLALQGVAVDAVPELVNDDDPSTTPMDCAVLQVLLGRTPTSPMDAEALRDLIQQTMVESVPKTS